MADPDPKDQTQTPGGEEAKTADQEEETKAAGKETRPWVKPVLAALALLLIAGGAGFGLGYLNRGGEDGPDLSPEEAFAQAREQARNAVTREMARRGFVAGARNGRSHGIIAGGMAAESRVVIKVRQMQASAAQSAAAAAQSELAGFSSGTPPPVPTVEADE